MKIDDAMVKEILTLPNEIRQKLLDVYLLETKISEVERAMSLHRNSVEKEILEARDEKGKPLFSNERMRSNELQRRLESDEKYKKYSETLSHFQELRAKDKIELESLKYRFRALEALLISGYRRGEKL